MFLAARGGVGARRQALTLFGCLMIGAQTAPGTEAGQAAASSSLARFTGLLEVMQSEVPVPKSALAAEVQELFLLCRRDLERHTVLITKLQALEESIGSIFRS